MFESIELEHDGVWIVLRGVPSATFLSDTARIYKYRFDPENLNKAKLFFSLSQSGMMFKRLSFAWHKYFNLEMYYIFEKLYDITQRSLYKDVLDLLMNEANVKRYFEPDLPIPSEITSRLNDLTVQLYDFQKTFINGYYQAKHKLGLDGYLLSFLAGGGKTLTSLATAYAFNILPCVVIGPRSTLDGWASSITRLIPSIKPNEIKISYSYNPAKDNSKWKFFIGNYERIDQALDYSKYADGNIRSLIVDECHNFRNLDTTRTKRLLNFKQATGINNVIAISATPIKSLGAELIPIMQLIDPEFDSTAQQIFRMVYNRSHYDPITGSVLKNRLTTYIERRTLEDSGIKLPPKERYEIRVKLKDPTPYLIDTMKDDLWKYINQHQFEYMRMTVPAMEYWKSLMKNPVITSNFSEEDIQAYMDAVQLKYEDPRDKEMGNAIAHFEKDMLKPIDQKLYKEVWTTRRKITSWMMILIGKALGIYFVKRKIELLAKMVKENIDDIVNIINGPDFKTVIFSTYIEPLVSVRDSLEEKGIGCILHTGQDDIRITRKQFGEDKNIKAFLATTSSVGTGTDGLQMIADKMILLNTPFRSSDLVQIEARIHRNGSPANSIKIYYMKLDTDQIPNLLDSEEEIVEWSRAMLRLAMD